MSGDDLAALTESIASLAPSTGGASPQADLELLAKLRSLVERAQEHHRAFGSAFALGGLLMGVMAVADEIAAVLAARRSS